MVAIRILPHILARWTRRGEVTEIDVGASPVRLLPALKYLIEGLEPDTRYTISLKMMALLDEEELEIASGTGRELSRKPLVIQGKWVTADRRRPQRGNVFRLYKGLEYIPVLLVSKVSNGMRSLYTARYRGTILKLVGNRRVETEDEEEDDDDNDDDTDEDDEESSDEDDDESTDEDEVSTDEEDDEDEGHDDEETDDDEDEDEDLDDEDADDEDEDHDDEDVDDAEDMDEDHDDEDADDDDEDEDEVEAEGDDNDGAEQVNGGQNYFQYLPPPQLQMLQDAPMMHYGAPLDNLLPPQLAFAQNDQAMMPGAQWNGHLLPWAQLQEPQNAPPPPPVFNPAQFQWNFQQPPAAPLNGFLPPGGQFAPLQTAPPPLLFNPAAVNQWGLPWDQLPQNAPAHQWNGQENQAAGGFAPRALPNLLAGMMPGEQYQPVPQNAQDHQWNLQENQAFPDQPYGPDAWVPVVAAPVEPNIESDEDGEGDNAME